MKVLDSKQTRELEQKAVDGGITYLELMENAGAAAADLLLQKGEVFGKSVAILCGRGNNGGDGYVVARRLAQRGARVSVVLVQGPPATDISREMFDRLRGTSVCTVDFSQQPDLARLWILSADFLFDGIYGIGFHGTAPTSMDAVFDAVEMSGAFVIALDLPSGVLCDTGEIEGRCVRADETVTFTTIKPAHLVEPARSRCGKVTVAPVGIGEELIAQMPCKLWMTDDDTVRPLFSPRKANTNKGSYGTLLAVCGSAGMAGAAVLSAGAALRCGVGLVDLALPEEIYPTAAARLAEPVFTLLKTDGAGALTGESRENLEAALQKASACLVGCGLGTGESARALVETLIGKVRAPLILDADGINIVAGNIDILKTAKAPVILTPHPGEMARLLKTSVPEVQAHRLRYAREFAEKHGAVLVLKGSGTVVASPDGRAYLNPTGNPGMAKGGSGDVLAGMIASFAAQGADPFLAAACGVYLHGAAGDACARRLSQRAMLPSDLIDELPELFLQFEQ